MSYFQDIRAGIKTTLTGLGLTARHLRQAVRRRAVLGIENDNYFEQQNGLVTVQYPHEALPIPDNGRYRLHNEIDDCIVCDKCAKICPVDCITIDPIKATEEVGRASDGSPIRLYAATFDIDMAKCCYCGLCTVVCPTECLTMEKTFDYSTYELGQLTYAFANLTPEQADEKRALYEQYVQEKEAAKAATRPTMPPPANPPGSDAPVKPRPAFRPGMKPAPPKPTDAEAAPTAPPAAPAANDVPTPQPLAKPRPVFRPGMKPTPAPDATPVEAETIAMQGIADQPGVTESVDAVGNEPTPAPPAADGLVSPKPAFRPTMKPKAADAPASTPPPAEPAQPPVADEASAAEVPPKPRPAFRPTMKPKPDQ